MRRRDGGVHDGVVSEHIMQLFDTSLSVAESLSTFVCDGLRDGDTVLMVITPQHWDLTTEHLAKRGCFIDEALADGRLIVRDAASTLATIARNGQPDADLFEARIGALLRGLHRPGVRIRIYGEMVDLLAHEGLFASVQRLETLWNDLTHRESVTVCCGYLAHHFGDPRSGPALDRICRLHDHIDNKPSDRLAAWLLAARPGLDHSDAGLPLD